MLDELMFYPILKSRSYKKYYLPVGGIKKPPEN